MGPWLTLTTFLPSGVKRGPTCSSNSFCPRLENQQFLRWVPALSHGRWYLDRAGRDHCAACPSNSQTKELSEKVQSDRKYHCGELRSTKKIRGTQLAQSEERGTLDVRIMSLSPTLSVESPKQSKTNK